MLHAARPEGLVLLERDDGVLIVIVTDSGLYGVTDLPADEAALARFRRRLAATDGWHGIVVSTPTGERGDSIYGFFECVLASPPPTSVGNGASQDRPR